MRTLAFLVCVWLVPAVAAAPGFDLARLSPDEDALYQPIKADADAVKKFIATRQYLLKAAPDPDHAPPMPAEVEFRFTVDKTEKLLLFRIMVTQGLKRTFS